MRILCFLILLFCSACVSKPEVSESVATPIAPPPPKRIEIQGHRGARWVRPENTMAAFKYAVEEGVDVLELDLHVTRDNVLVITHDPILNRKICLGPKGRILKRPVVVRRLTLKQLRRYDCGSLINPLFPRQMTEDAEPIPTLEELLIWLKDNPKASQVKLNVEIKSDPRKPKLTPEPEQFASYVLSLVRKHGLMDRLTIQSFNPRALLAAREMDAGVMLSYLMERPTEEPLVQIAKKLGANIVSMNHEWVTVEDVESLHQAGIRVIPWTANDEASWKRLSQIGVDGIITDNPKGLREFLRR